jgi:putative glutamine amidotransferase
MAHKPVILITSSFEAKGAEFDDESCSVSDCYLTSTFDAGGIPWIMPRIPSEALAMESVAVADGLMLTGGDDLQGGLHRSRLAERLAKKCHPPDPKRDALELMLINAALRMRKPIFAICRGHQILNVALGGNLYVDIPSELPRARKHNCSDEKDGLVHDITIEPDSLLGEIVGVKKLAVNSCHHQAIKALSSALRITAASDDGIIEAVELKKKAASPGTFVLSVQFHPERLVTVDPVYARLFERFVAACEVAH